MYKYRQISNISRTVTDNIIVDHSDVVGACRRCSNYIFIPDLTSGFNELGEDNCKTRRGTFKFWDLCLILEIWRYIYVDYKNTDQAWSRHQHIFITNGQRKTRKYLKLISRHPIPFARFVLPKSRISATKPSFVNSSKRNGRNRTYFDEPQS